MRETPGDPIFFNLADQFLDRHIREGRAQKVAIRCGDSFRTYGDLAADVNRAGNGLLRLGLQEEQRVLLLLPDCPDFAIAYFSVIKIGAVAVPTSTAARTADYDYVLRES
jgi:acyl-coenzyme A synthetase/AMP-(fatty) acid ligase